MKFEYIIFDRTSFLLRGDDRLTIQRVSPWIYKASIPAWFFNLEKFKNFFATKYELIAEFESLDKTNIPSIYKGLLLKLKNKE